MRNRLIELIDQKQVYGIYHNLYLRDNDELADHLLANGVVVPPCKVGQTVYVTDILSGKICECEVITVKGFAGEENTLIEYAAPKEITGVVSYESPDTEIGISIFLTREEAEEALAERSNENAD